jgi:hypothetical protein
MSNRETLVRPISNGRKHYRAIPLAKTLLDEYCGNSHRDNAKRVQQELELNKHLQRSCHPSSPCHKKRFRSISRPMKTGINGKPKSSALRIESAADCRRARFTGNPPLTRTWFSANINPHRTKISPAVLMQDILTSAKRYESKYHDVGAAHYLAAQHYGKLNTALTTPVIIITGALGTTIFATLNHSPDQLWKMVAGSTSLLGTVLASLQAFYNYQGLAERHKRAGEKYRSLQRRFESFQMKFTLALPTERDSALTSFDLLKKELDEVAATSPSLPNRFYKRAQRDSREKRLKEQTTHRQGAAAISHAAPEQN